MLRHGDALLALGRGPGLGVVAEEVETEAQGSFHGSPAPASHMLEAAPGQARRFRADRTAQPHPAARAPRRQAGGRSRA